MAVLVVAAGLLTILSVLLMTGLGGSIPPRPGSEYKSRMVEFELVLSQEELARVLDSQEVRSRLDANNRWDFLFMICYSLLNAAFFLYVASLNRLRQRKRFRGSGFIRTGLALSVSMWAADAAETLQLLDLSAESPQSGDSGLWVLIVATRLKWGALFAACAALGLGFAAYAGRSGGILIAVLFASAGVVGFMSLAHPDTRPLCELATALMAVGWIFLLGHAVIRAFTPARVQGA